MKSTRQRLIEYLQTKRIASASEMAHAVHKTPANIRHHLGVLLREGVVEFARERQAHRRGRPEQLYQLSHLAFLHNMDGLARTLLEEIAALPQQERQTWIQMIAGRMAGETIQAASNPTRRLYQAVKKLNEMNYLARWEAHKDAPRIILTHCPYAAILPEHPELCLMDTQLLESMLSVPIVQKTRLELNDQGIPQCIFSVVSKL